MASRLAHYHSRPGKFMTRIVVHALHGTFQTPEVWAGLEERLAAALVGSSGRSASSAASGTLRVEVAAEAIEPPSADGPREWAERFCRRVGTDREGAGPRDTPRRVLLGYSLGGRLALHAVLHCPRTWDAAVVVAAHPGGDDAAERAAVRERDDRWAARCRTEPLDDLLEDWDALPVFGGRPNRARRSAAGLDPERCARIFEAFSRADQEDLRPALAAAGASAELPPMLYLTGAGDETYGAIGRRLGGLVPRLIHLQVAGAGHRVPWDRPERFAAAVADFLRYRFGGPAPAAGP